MFTLSSTDPVLTAFEESQIAHPVPSKDAGDRTIYPSGALQMPTGSHDVQLGDYASSVWGDEENSDLAQPNLYRAPEVILRQNWSYSADIWNLGCIVRSNLLLFCLLE